MELILSLSRVNVSQACSDKISAICHHLDWAYVAYLADRHRVLPIFFSNIKKLGLGHLLPEIISKNMSLQHLRIIGGNLRFNKNLLLIIELFERHKIPAVPFKGPLLAYELYGTSDLRYYQDLDILIPEKDVTSAWTILKSVGYHPRIRLAEAQIKIYAKFENELDFIDHTGQVFIDLHWRLVPHSRYPYNFDFCKRRLKSVILNNKPVSALSDEDMVLYLCIKGCRDVWDNLESLLCVADYICLHPDLDWHLVIQLAGILNCERMLFIGIFLAQDVFSVKFPFYVMEKMAADRMIKPLVGFIYQNLFQPHHHKSEFEKNVFHLPYHFKLRSRRIDKFRFGFNRIFCPRKKDWIFFPVNSKLPFLYYLLRPMRQMIEFLSSKLNVS